MHAVLRIRTSENFRTSKTLLILFIDDLYSNKNLFFPSPFLSGCPSFLPLSSPAMKIVCSRVPMMRLDGGHV